MTRETKLGLAAIGVLLTAFAGVLYLRLAGPGEPTPSTAEASSAAKRAASSQSTANEAKAGDGSAAASLTTGSPVASGPLSSRRTGRSDPFGPSMSRASASADDDDSDDSRGAASGRYGRSADRGAADEFLPEADDSGNDAEDDDDVGESGAGARYARAYPTDDDAVEEDFDQEIPDAADADSQSRASLEADATWDEEPVAARYRSRATADHSDWDAGDADIDTDRPLAGTVDEQGMVSESADEAFDPIPGSSAEPELIDEAEAPLPLVADEEEDASDDDPSTSPTWRLRESDASRAGYESDQPSRRPLSIGRPRAADTAAAFTGDNGEGLSPEPMSNEPMSNELLSPEPMSNELLPSEAIATELLPLDADHAVPPATPHRSAANSSRNPGDGVHTVVEGESLFDIARRRFGSAMRWSEIYELNRDLLGSELENLPAGLELALPPLSPPRAIAPLPTRRSARPGASYR
jgi:nucleoid-associated protein YgaU